MSLNEHQAVAQELTKRLSQQLNVVILDLLRGGLDVGSSTLQLECSLATIPDSAGAATTRRKVASLDISKALDHSIEPQLLGRRRSALVSPTTSRSDAVQSSSAQIGPLGTPASTASTTEDEECPRPSKVRKATGGLRVSSARHSDNEANAVTRRLDSDGRVFPQRKKRLLEKPLPQPSTLEKFVSGVWESIFSSMKLDPNEVIQQWQAIESNGQPRLLTDTEHEVALRQSTAVEGVFGRMNVLTRKISQTSRTCRSLEVIVQASWVQCFDDRVSELAESMSREKAKKTAIAEACVDFDWSEKELRNKMGVWRGYHDIQQTAGWAALVFAGMGLYRFCKYRVAFTEEAFQRLRALKHRFEVGADTLHPHWRQLLGIVGGPTTTRYTGHPHDWVVGDAVEEGIPLPQTYQQWNKDFEYVHLDESTVDEEVWGLYDPRVINAVTTAQAQTCQVCGERQSDDPRENSCACFPTLYGSVKPASSLPVQVYRTPNGKNNGLLACLPFERGAAIGEFVGQITSGLSNMDVMVGQTEKATYQIWQGKEGNHTRFVNHSCQPNSQFERFVWHGSQRVVLVSKGIEADEEITVDYSDTYWKNLDKTCLCGQPKCRYRNRESRALQDGAESVDGEE